MMRLVLVALALLAAAPAAAQVQSRPTDPPLVTASNESWYQLREPVQYAGELYYPAGAQIFFNGNTMVRVGHYNGVPLYADATVEPFSVVLVPVSRGQMQPYERPRRGDLAGTTGSSAPAFPVAVVPQAAAPRAAAVSPAREAVGTTGVIATPRARTGSPLVTLRRPESNEGIWIPFGGERWVAAGAAVPMTAATFVRVGEYRGFPVYARRELQEDVIYLPATRAGLVAPYRLKD